MSIQEQLRDTLTKKAVRVIDLFREWDENGDGKVTKKEFRQALPLLGLDAAKTDMDALFDEWDKDKTGSITFDELNKLLRRCALHSHRAAVLRPCCIA